jgi:hypothetical protein
MIKLRIFKINGDSKMPEEQVLDKAIITHSHRDSLLAFRTQ